MASIVLARIDSRLIHGQVVTKWVRSVGSNRIIIIDNTLADDKFMLDVYSMAAPPGVKVQILHTNVFAKDWEAGKYKGDKVLLLFKDVDHVWKLLEEGFDLSELQVGGLGSGSGRIRVYNNICFNRNDVELLKKISGKGTKVYLQPVPEDRARTLEESIKGLEAKLEN